MILYLTVISLSAAVIALGNLLLHSPAAQWGIFPTVLLVALEVAAVILLDGLEALLIRRLPERYFEAERPVFAVSPAERRLWRALGVRRWCDKIPELGGFSGFHKDRVREPKNSTYLARFLLESNYGVAIHLANALSGLLLLAILPKITLWVALPVACVNCILSLLPLGALRYNAPALLSLYRLAKKRGL